MATSPLVSIVIPVFNGENYMRRAIDSALAQTYSHIEVIVVNDGSKDDGKTEQIAQSYSDKIRFFGKPNGGVSTALNLGIEQMRGEYFSWLSHDDVYYPQKVQRQIEAISQYGDPRAVCYSDYDIIDATGTIRSQWTNPPVAAGMFRPSLIHGLGMHGCALLIHRSHFERVGLFNPALRVTQDYDLWFRIGKQATVFGMSERLIQSREHGESGSVRLDTRKEEYWLFRRAIDDLSDAELRFAGDPATTYLKLAAQLVRSPKRCSSATYAFAKYQSTPGHRLSHLPLRLRYQAYLAWRSRQGFVLGESDIGTPPSLNPPVLSSK